MSKVWKRWLLGMGLCVPALVAMPARAAVFELDADHSEVSFSVRHMMMTNVRGFFRQIQGTLVWDEKDVTKSTVEVTMTTSSLDTQAVKRDDHLRSPDFLDAAKYPTITFKSTKVQKAGKGLKVTGNLTIKDASRPVILNIQSLSKPVKDPFGMIRAGVQGKTKINRKNFGLTWNQALETGGVLVGEDVDIDINAEFIKRETTAPDVPTSATPKE